MKNFDRSVLVALFARPASRRSASPPLSLTDLKFPPTSSAHVLVEGRDRFPRRHQPAIRIRPTSWFKESRGQDFFFDDDLTSADWSEPRPQAAQTKKVTQKHISSENYEDN